ncbi:MAG: sigma-70 family RNA polymerase sigma factor [Tannerellaceae bacterium]|jgi:RNA polymerase sigma-70 factor (ECF subfamily)|nr:sigma-70 family RNA polymerase sigma factor [Tannerellaceae bacterium]
MAKTDKEEFLSLLRSYQGIIHKVNLIYFSVSEDRKDNFQEVVYNMWKAYPALKNKDKIASWIYAISINTSISKIRKDSRYTFSGDMESINISSLDDDVEVTIDFQRLLDAIRQLKEADKSIMLLYLEDYSYNEIGDIIGISSSNVGARINRAKKQLEKLLK